MSRLATYGRYPKLALAGAALVAAVAFGGILALAHDYRLQDFECFRAAAALVLEGADPYDPPTWHAATAARAAPPGGAGWTTCLGQRFAYPLWTAVALAPLALLPYPANAALWAGLNAAAALAGAGLALFAARGDARRLPLLLAIVASSQPFVTTLNAGQIDGLALGAIGAASFALATGRDGLAGAMLASLLAKPQLALASPVLALRALREGRPFVAVAGGVTAAALLVTALAAQPGWLGGWLAEVTGPRARLATALPTAWGLGADVAGDGRIGLVVAAGIALGVAALLRGRTLGDVELLALLTALSLAVVPHAWSYDHLVLGACVAVLLARVRRTAAVAAIALGSAALPWLLYAVALARGTETLSALVPIAAALALAAVAPRQASRGTRR